MEFEKEIASIPEVIPIFPLPSTVFYPKTLLPLHIFEPRYRQMVKESLDSHRLIGMVKLMPNWEEKYWENPEIQNIGCVGKMERVSSLEDGKYNIYLTGLSRFRILEEIPGKPYRQAKVELLKDSNDSVLQAHEIEDHPVIRHYNNFIELLPSKAKIPLQIDAQLCKTLGNLIDLIVHQFELNSEKKQDFLEQLDVEERMDYLIKVLDLKKQIVQYSKDNFKENFDFRRN